MVSLKRIGEEIDEAHIERLLESNSKRKLHPSSEILEVKMCLIRRHHPSVRNLNH